MAISLQWQLGQFDSVAAGVADLDAKLTDPVMRLQFLGPKMEFARLRGKLDESARIANEARDLMVRVGYPGPEVNRAVALAWDQAWFRGDGPGAQRMLDDALARSPLRTLPASDAPYPDVALTYATAGRPDRARAVIAEWSARRAEAPTTRDSVLAARMRAAVALAEGKYTDAQADLRITEHQGCIVCDLPMLARAYDLAGSADSAIAIYSRFLTTPELDRVASDGSFIPVVHKRLGELYDAKGQREKALEHYRAFTDLWKDADPVLQPKVADARQRVAALTRGTDGAREARR